MRKIIKNKGQALIMWAIGIALAGISGLTANQFRLSEKIEKNEKNYYEINSDIKAINVNIKNINDTLNAVFETRIKTNNNKLK